MQQQQSQYQRNKSASSFHSYASSTSSFTPSATATLPMDGNYSHGDSSSNSSSNSSSSGSSSSRSSSDDEDDNEGSHPWRRRQQRQRQRNEENYEQHRQQQEEIAKRASLTSLASTVTPPYDDTDVANAINNATHTHKEPVNFTPSNYGSYSNNHHRSKNNNDRDNTNGQDNEEVDLRLSTYTNDLSSSAYSIFSEMSFGDLSCSMNDLNSPNSNSTTPLPPPSLAKIFAIVDQVHKAKQKAVLTASMKLKEQQLKESISQGSGKGNAAAENGLDWEGGNNVDFGNNNDNNDSNNNANNDPTTNFKPSLIKVKVDVATIASREVDKFYTKRDQVRRRQRLQKQKERLLEKQLQEKEEKMKEKEKEEKMKQQEQQREISTFSWGEEEETAAAVTTTAAATTGEEGNRFLQENDGRDGENNDDYFDDDDDNYDGNAQLTSQNKGESSLKSSLFGGVMPYEGQNGNSQKSPQDEGTSSLNSSLFGGVMSYDGENGNSYTAPQEKGTSSLKSSLFGDIMPTGHNVNAHMASQREAKSKSTPTIAAKSKSTSLEGILAKAQKESNGVIKLPMKTSSSKYNNYNSDNLSQDGTAVSAGIGSLAGQSVTFSYKDIYGSDDDDITSDYPDVGFSNYWKHNAVVPAGLSDNNFDASQGPTDFNNDFISMHSKSISALQDDGSSSSDGGGNYGNNRSSMMSIRFDDLNESNRSVGSRRSSRNSSFMSEGHISEDDDEDDSGGEKQEDQIPTWMAKLKKMGWTNPLERNSQQQLPPAPPPQQQDQQQTLSAYSQQPKSSQSHSSSESASDEMPSRRKERQRRKSQQDRRKNNDSKLKKSPTASSNNSIDSGNDAAEEDEVASHLSHFSSIASLVLPRAFRLDKELGGKDSISKSSSQSSLKSIQKSQHSQSSQSRRQPYQHHPQQQQQHDQYEQQNTHSEIGVNYDDSGWRDTTEHDDDQSSVEDGGINPQHQQKSKLSESNGNDFDECSLPDTKGNHADGGCVEQEEMPPHHYCKEDGMKKQSDDINATHDDPHLMQQLEQQRQQQEEHQRQQEEFQRQHEEFKRQHEIFQQQHEEFQLGNQPSAPGLLLKQQRLSDFGISDQKESGVFAPTDINCGNEDEKLSHSQAHKEGKRQNLLKMIQDYSPPGSDSEQLDDSLKYDNAEMEQVQTPKQSSMESINSGQSINDDLSEGNAEHHSVESEQNKLESSPGPQQNSRTSMKERSPGEASIDDDDNGMPSHRLSATSQTPSTQSSNSYHSQSSQPEETSTASSLPSQLSSVVQREGNSSESQLISTQSVQSNYSHRAPSHSDNLEDVSKQIEKSVYIDAENDTKGSKQTEQKRDFEASPNPLVSRPRGSSSAASIDSFTEINDTVEDSENKVAFSKSDTAKEETANTAISNGPQERSTQPSGSQLTLSISVQSLESHESHLGTSSYNSPHVTAKEVESLVLLAEEKKNETSAIEVDVETKQSSMSPHESDPEKIPLESDYIGTIKVGALHGTVDDDNNAQNRVILEEKLPNPLRVIFELERSQPSLFDDDEEAPAPLRPSVLSAFNSANDRASFRRKVPYESASKASDLSEAVDWPSRVSSLESMTLLGEKDDTVDSKHAGSPSKSRSSDNDDENMSSKPKRIEERQVSDEQESFISREHTDLPQDESSSKPDFTLSYESGMAAVSEKTNLIEPSAQEENMGCNFDLNADATNAKPVTTRSGSVQGSELTDDCNDGNSTLSTLKCVDTECGTPSPNVDEANSKINRSGNSEDHFEVSMSTEQQTNLSRSHFDQGENFHVSDDPDHDCSLKFVTDAPLDATDIGKSDFSPKKADVSHNIDVSDLDRNTSTDFPVSDAYKDTMEGGSRPKMSLDESNRTFEFEDCSKIRDVALALAKERSDSPVYSGKVGPIGAYSVSDEYEIARGNVVWPKAKSDEKNSFGFEGHATMAKQMSERSPKAKKVVLRNDANFRSSLPNRSPTYKLADQRSESPMYSDNDDDSTSDGYENVRGSVVWPKSKSDEKNPFEIEGFAAMAKQMSERSPKAKKDVLRNDANFRSSLPNRSPTYRQADQRSESPVYSDNDDDFTSDGYENARGRVVWPKAKPDDENPFVSSMVKQMSQTSLNSHRSLRSHRIALVKHASQNSLKAKEAAWDLSDGSLDANTQSPRSNRSMNEDENDEPLKGHSALDTDLHHGEMLENHAPISSDTHCEEVTPEFTTSTAIKVNLGDRDGDGGSMPETKSVRQTPYQKDIRRRISLQSESSLSTLDSLASPIDQGITNKPNKKNAQLFAMKREPSDSSLSSLDSLASPTQFLRNNTAVSNQRKGQCASKKETTNAEEVHSYNLPQQEDLSLSNHSLREQLHELSFNEHIPEKGLDFSTMSGRGSHRNSHRGSALTSLGGSISLCDLDDDDTTVQSKDHVNETTPLSQSDSTPVGRSERSIGKAEDFLSSGFTNDFTSYDRSCRTMFSTDGIEHINPKATDSGRDDFDFAMESYANAIRFGHLDQHDSGVEDNDHVLAARAYMGLGFARQCKGELESSLDAYTKALQLLEMEVGQYDPENACLQFTIGTVLKEMQRQLEASTHFNNALRLFKSRNAFAGVDKASILCTEGMIFSAVGEVNSAIECFRKALLLYQHSNHPLDLKFATIMFEMGSLLSQCDDYEDSANCYKFALEIRKARLGESFLVARTYYSLGVTIASQELNTNVAVASASHLEEALRICHLEFGDENLQSAIIIHAMGVLNERKGDFLAASVWFTRERKIRKTLLGADDESVAAVSSDLGTCYYNSGKYELATLLFGDALRIKSLSGDEENLEVADMLYKIASCHDSLCEYDEALEKFNEVKRIRESHYGLDSSPVVQTMLRIGNIQLGKGETKAALECFSEILGIGFANDSINAIEVANALYGRGCAQLCSFMLTDAMKSFTESLNWKLAALGEDDPGLACIFYQMAHVYLEQSDSDEAVTCFEEYKRLQKLEKQRNLHDNAEICFAEGIVAKLQGRTAAALSFYKQALTMFETLFGSDHEKVASIHFDIGCVQISLGDYENALPHFQSCLDKRRLLLGCHVDVANVLYEMASVYSHQNNVALATECLEESVEIWKLKLEGGEKLASVCHVSGKLWKSLRRYKDAEENLEQALELYITIHGQHHETVAATLLDLAELLQEINQIEQALFCFEESLQIRTEIFGPEDPVVAEVLYSKGVAFLFHKKFKEANYCLNRSLEIRREKLGPMDGAVGDTLNTIGFLQLRMGNIHGDEALQFLNQALEIRKEVGNKSKVVSTLQNIASIYKKRKEYDLCTETYSDLLAVRQEEFGTNDERVADAWINLGNVQVSANRVVEATVSYEEALRIRTLINGYNHKSVAQVLFKIGSLNSRLNRYTVAKQLFEEYIRIRAEEEDDPDEEMAQALTLMGDLQRESKEKSKAQINWMSALEIYCQLGYPEDHPKVVKLLSRQKHVPFGLFGQQRKSISSLASFSIYGS